MNASSQARSMARRYEFTSYRSPGVHLARRFLFVPGRLPHVNGVLRDERSFFSPFGFGIFWRKDICLRIERF